MWSVESKRQESPSPPPLFSSLSPPPTAAPHSGCIPKLLATEPCQTTHEPLQSKVWFHIISSGAVGDLGGKESAGVEAAGDSQEAIPRAKVSRHLGDGGVLIGMLGGGGLGWGRDSWGFWEGRGHEASPPPAWTSWKTWMGHRAAAGSISAGRCQSLGQPHWRLHSSTRGRPSRPQSPFSRRLLYFCPKHRPFTPFLTLIFFFKWLHYFLQDIYFLKDLFLKKKNHYLW